MIEDADEAAEAGVMEVYDVRWADCSETTDLSPEIRLERILGALGKIYNWAKLWKILHRRGAVEAGDYALLAREEEGMEGGVEGAEETGEGSGGSPSFRRVNAVKALCRRGLLSRRRFLSRGSGLRLLILHWKIMVLPWKEEAKQLLEVILSSRCRWIRFEENHHKA